MVLDRVKERMIPLLRSGQILCLSIDIPISIVSARSLQRSFPSSVFVPSSLDTGLYRSIYRMYGGWRWRVETETEGERLDCYVMMMRFSRVYLGLLSAACLRL